MLPSTSPSPPPAEQHREQRLDRAVHLPGVDAELACDLPGRNFVIELVEIGHANFRLH
jgi:hypothetical protein